MTDTPDGASDDTAQAATDPTPVDNTTPPVDVLRALGFDPDTVRSVVITSTSVVAVAADYPDPPVPAQPEEPTDAD
ncbi:hypothetical protein GCM10025864_44590 [Luteimicrobium album]|uniref:Uncharacterized protein n=1 Tax=Luteimicrobium album TaxID=1054550 RepID=A0ABQ6HXR4_9MICO|nr:hypothetical protein [Luteimicrobium album]GMA22294.1 hypothetical protein GCM10025864_00530 [Luteimicrobium album]GMA26700.1 hypothetical protein GCM10025864_44590 [Luteimicrobium album]